MKKIYALILLVAATVFVSCESELNVEPAQSISQDAALATEANILNILIGTYDEAGQAATFGGRTHLIADLLGSTNEIAWTGTFLDPRQFFTKSILVDNGFVAGHWANSYEVINQANLVIDNVAKITSSTANRDKAEGEAKFLRALTYFDLVRLFADPYVAGGANAQLGVPLHLKGILDYGGNLDIARSTVAEVYTQILSDLTDAVAKLPATNEFFADRFSARALQARVYFQQGNYAAARDAANDVITNSGHALTSTYAGAFNNNADSSEDIFAFQVTAQTGTNQMITFYASQANGGRGGDVGVRAGYTALFDTPATDVRATFTYVSPDNGENLTSKYTNQFGNVPVIRFAEMHLIRAESNFRMSTTTGLAPLVEINALRARSGAPALAGPLTLNLLFNERRLELGFEGHLLHDYKRTQRSVGTTAYNAGNLVLPIPQAEMDTNSLMVQNTFYR